MPGQTAQNSNYDDDSSRCRGRSRSVGPSLESRVVARRIRLMQGERPMFVRALRGNESRAPSVLDAAPVSCSKKVLTPVSGATFLKDLLKVCGMSRNKSNSCSCHVLSTAHIAGTGTAYAL